MIKTRVENMFKMIDEMTKENDGKPVVFIGLNIPLTKKNWICIQAIAKFELEKETPLILEKQIWC